MHSNNVGRKVDPDRTAASVWSGSTVFAQTYLSEWNQMSLHISTEFFKSSTIYKVLSSVQIAAANSTDCQNLIIGSIRATVIYLQI